MIRSTFSFVRTVSATVVTALTLFASATSALSLGGPEFNSANITVTPTTTYVGENITVQISDIKDQFNDAYTPTSISIEAQSGSGNAQYDLTPGQASYNYPIEATEEGIYTITVSIDGSQVSIANVIVTSAPFLYSYSMTLSKNTVYVGDTVQVTISDLKDQYGNAFVPSAVQLQLTDPAHGIQRFDLSPDQGTYIQTLNCDLEGSYSIALFIDSELKEMIMFTGIAKPAFGSADITGPPTQLEVGESYSILVQDLVDEFSNVYIANTVQVAITGPTSKNEDLTADQGVYTYNDSFDQPGNYTVNVLIDGEIIRTFPVEVTAPPKPVFQSADVTGPPAQLNVGESYDILLQTLLDNNSNQYIATTVEVVIAGPTSKTEPLIDDHGSYAYKDYFDQPGTYTIDVVVDGQTIESYTVEVVSKGGNVRPDLRCGRSWTHTRGDDIYDRKTASNRQELNFQTRRKTTDFHFSVQNDGKNADIDHVRGRVFPRRYCETRFFGPAGEGNVTAQMRRGNCATACEQGEIVRYRGVVRKTTKRKRATVRARLKAVSQIERGKEDFNRVNVTFTR